MRIAREYEDATASLQRAIEGTIRDVAKAPSAKLFPAEAMELARLPMSMGGMGVTKLTRGVTKLTRDSAAVAVAGMRSVASYQINSYAQHRPRSGFLIRQKMVINFNA